MVILPGPAPHHNKLKRHRDETAQTALEKAGALTEFQALSLPEGQAIRILDTAGPVLRDWRNPARVSRPTLRSTAGNSVICCSALSTRSGGVTQVAPETRDVVLVHFANGRQETFDLVVGVDGDWSRTRPVDRRRFRGCMWSARSSAAWNTWKGTDHPMWPNALPL